MLVLTTTIKTLLCLMFLGISRQETPQYSYECKENGEIVLHGFSLNSFIQLVSVNNINIIKNKNCTKHTYSSDGFGHILIPKECIIGTNVSVDRAVVFLADDSVIDGRTKPTTAATPAAASISLSATTANTNAMTQALANANASNPLITAAPIPAPIRKQATGSGKGISTTGTTATASTTGTTAKTSTASGTPSTTPTTPTTSTSTKGTTSTTATTSTTGTVMSKPSTVSAVNGTAKKDVVTLSYGQRYHYFRIECKMIPEGVVDHVIGHVGVKNVVLLPNMFNSIGTVEMRFKSEEATKETSLNELPDISTVYLGDKFYMYLKYIGEQDYSISPQICTTYGDGDRAVVEKLTRTKKVELWNYKNCVSPMSNKLHLMHTFKNLTDKIMYAEIFGFHFDTDADITIECDVKVCAKPSSDPKCTFKTECDAKDWKLAKRSTREEDNTMTVKRSLHVLERQLGNSNSAGLLHFKWTCLVVLQFMLYLY